MALSSPNVLCGCLEDKVFHDKSAHNLHTAFFVQPGNYLTSFLEFPRPTHVTLNMPLCVCVCVCGRARGLCNDAVNI